MSNPGRPVAHVNSGDALMRTLFAAALTLAFASAAAAEDKKVALTGENTKVTFVGTKTDGKHEGGFKALTGTATVTGDDLTTLKIEVEIDMDSTWSDAEKLTAHLKAPDFFSVKDYPKAKFVSTKVTKTESGVTITGDLTLRGKTNSISIPATVAAADGKFKLNSSFTIDKTQFGMTYGAGKIDDKVALTVAVEAK
jgi:polyisoprenoid-binding protein YceI